MKTMSFQEVIEEKGMFIYTPSGTSMLPLIKEGVDTVKLIKITRKLKKYDIVLYKRNNNQAVLHRIVRIKGDYFDMLGDNQFQIERNIPRESIIAIMEGLYRGEQYLVMNSIKQKSYAWFRINFRFLRRIRRKIINIFIRKK